MEMQSDASLTFVMRSALQAPPLVYVRIRQQSSGLGTNKPVSVRPPAASSSSVPAEVPLLSSPLLSSPLLSSPPLPSSRYDSLQQPAF